MSLVGGDAKKNPPFHIKKKGFYVFSISNLEEHFTQKEKKRKCMCMLVHTYLEGIVVSDIKKTLRTYSPFSYHKEEGKMITKKKKQLFHKNNVKF